MRLLVTGGSGCHWTALSQARGFRGPRGVDPRPFGGGRRGGPASRGHGRRWGFDRPGSLDEAFAVGADCLVNIASLDFGHAESIVAAAEEAGLARDVFVSTTAVTTRLPASSKVVRLAAEETVRSSELRWTILRPTMIDELPGDRNLSRLLRLLRRTPIVPLPGGVAVVLALLLGAAAGGAADEPTVALVLLITALCALVGLAEDVRGIPVVPRFGLLLLACAPLGLLPNGSPGTRALLGLLAVAFALAFVNAVNFIDGINGISVAQGLVAGGAYAVLAASRDLDGLAVVAAATAAAAASFAPFNVPRARVFLGDTGSYGLGAVLAGIAVLLVVEGVSVEAALAPLALYLADTGSTLLRRFRAGEDWHLPHRTHVYQRLTDHGLTHVQVSGLVLVLLVLCSGLGSLSLQGGSARLLGDVAVVVVLGAYLSLPGLVARQRSLA